MNYLEAKSRIEGLGFSFNRYSYCQVRFHNRNETVKHYFCKAVLCKVLNDKGLRFMTEFDFPTGACADVYVIDLHKVVEFESVVSPLKRLEKQGQYRRYGLDLVIVYCDSVPDVASEAYKFFLANKDLGI